MPWCPNCKTQQEQGTERCTQCGELLVDKIQEPSDMPPALEHPVQLISTSDQVEREMLKGLLEREGIRVVALDKHTESYLKSYMGYPMCEKELFVDEKDYPHAKELMEAFFQPAEGAGQEDETCQDAMDACLGEGISNGKEKPIYEDVITSKDRDTLPPRPKPIYEMTWRERFAEKGAWGKGFMILYVLLAILGAVTTTLGIISVLMYR